MISLVIVIESEYGPHGENNNVHTSTQKDLYMYKHDNLQAVQLTCLCTKRGLLGGLVVACCTPNRDVLTGGTEFLP